MWAVRLRRAMLQNLRDAENQLFIANGDGMVGCVLSAECHASFYALATIATTDECRHTVPQVFQVKKLEFVI